MKVFDLAEELYQRLMVCYYRLGNNADIVSVYERLKNVLSTASGNTPSPKMEQFFKNLTDE
ncbi:MAG: bacterial transcriptional activator domain-containing protein [Planctomycetota bacterium]